MLFEITEELRAELERFNVPAEVVYGPERSESRAPVRTRIVIDVADGTPDTYSPPIAQGQRPDVVFVRGMGCKFRIYAQSTAAGARIADHRRLADHFVMHVVVGLNDVLRRRRNGFSMGPGGFLKTDDIKTSTTWAGAVYEATFTVTRALRRETWAGEGAPTATLTGVRSTTKVSEALASSSSPAAPPPANAETACGG